MLAIPGLSRARSPFLDRGGIGTLLGTDRRHRVHADAHSLRMIKDRLFQVASEKHGRIVAHIRDCHLAEIEHYIAIYVHGHEFNEDERPDLDGDSWTWRVGIGTYSDRSGAVRPWTRSLDDAALMMRLHCPWLRAKVRLGGKPGFTARFSRSHPLPALQGTVVQLPETWPDAVRDRPAIGVCYAVLEAAAMEKELGFPMPAVVTREAA